MGENKKYDKGTIGWLREQQKIKAKKDGFDNIDDWLKWKVDRFNILEKKYGKEFADWARQNKGKVPNKWLNAGCKTLKEYREKNSQDAGFKNYNERRNYDDWGKGKHIPKEFNEDCPAYFGDFTENLMIQTFEDPIKMPYGNPGFDWTCKRGDKIDNKGACLTYDKRWIWWSGWKFLIRYNNITDWFILSAWDNRNSLNPLHVWVFHKNDIVRGRKFCEFKSFSITNNSKKLKELEKWEVTNRLDKLKELCGNLR